MRSSERVAAAVERASDVRDLVYGSIKYRITKGPWPSMIFVLGTGRSGTNWVGQILSTHPDVSISFERRPVFELSRDMALDPRLCARLFPKLAERYRHERARVSPRHYGDKSHTNIWIAQGLAKEFPDAVFVGVRRGVFGTVASMLKHRGVLESIENWRRYPVPNRFLGIEDGKVYDGLPLAARCALRWRSHEERFKELAVSLGERLIVLEYEAIHRKPAQELEKLERAIGLSTPIPMPTTDRAALDRWRSELSDGEISQICSVLAR